MKINNSNNFTKKMKPPFHHLDDTALGHYFTQLPFYGKLLLKMLEGSKYENIKLYGCIVVHLSDNGEYEEFRVEQDRKYISDLDLEIKKITKK